ncbi:hypothetical protein BFP97_16785 [Roseivirga sp. 4D4]|nr:hypothetical protein BFP97_16785 [Roseivirga sp. 4D4]
MFDISAPLNPLQINVVRLFLKRVNELIPFSQCENVDWSDDQIASRVVVYQRIINLGEGCPEKAALEYCRLLIGLQTEELLKTVKSTRSVH